MEEICCQWSGAGWEVSDEHEDDHDNHLQFIQAIIELKTALKVCRPLSKSDYTNIIRNFPAVCGSDINLHFRSDNFSLPAQEFCGNDSMFVNNYIDNSHLECISSSTISYVVQSSVVSSHLYGSVMFLLRYLYTCLFSTNAEKLETFLNRWKDSLMESAVSVIVDLIECSHDPDQEYYIYCSDFLRNVIDRIFITKDDFPFTLLENRSVIVIQMCESPQLCETTIHHIMNKVVHFCEDLMPFVNYENSSATFGVQGYDTLFYLFYLLKKLIAKLDINEKAYSNAAIHQKNVIEMWKHSWNLIRDTHLLNEIPENQWVHKLEQVVRSTLIDYPNFSFFAWTVLKTLDSLY